MMAVTPSWLPVDRIVATLRTLVDQFERCC